MMEVTAQRLVNHCEALKMYCSIILDVFIFAKTISDTSVLTDAIPACTSACV